MMGAPIDAGDDRIGGSLQLIVEAAFDEPAEHRIGRVVTVEGKGADVRIMATSAHCLVHGLDDVTADAELMERLI